MEQPAELVAKVSRSAAANFRAEFLDRIRRLAENPYQFPPYDDPNLPDDVYRKVLFVKWHKAVFSVEGETVCIDAIVDGRSDSRLG